MSTLGVLLLCIPFVAALRSRFANETTEEIPPEEELQKHLKNWQEESNQLPPVEKFRPLYEKHYNTERHLRDPKPESIKLVLGVFSCAQDARHRDVIRETWMRQEGVCYAQRNPVEGCSVHVTFVLGKNASAPDVSAAEHEEQMQERGITVLNMTENMNLGKSFKWLDEAQERFPWASHIGKTDMDSYPFLYKLLRRMDQNRSCVADASPYEFIGRPLSWCLGKEDADCEFDRSLSNHSCPETDCLGQFHTKFVDDIGLGEHWDFLSGPLYIMNMPLVKAGTWSLQWSRSGVRDVFRATGPEDVKVSQQVEEVARAEGRCVAIRRLDANVHKYDKVDADYANDI